MKSKDVLFDAYYCKNFGFQKLHSQLIIKEFDMDLMNIFYK